jgi:uncharacterized protein (TIGR00730 family)
MGIMGAIAGRLVELGGNVHGIIPKALLEYETSKERPSYGKTTVVGDMHTRKRLMAKESDAFIALPGGFGTMEELMEVTPAPLSLCIVVDGRLLRGRNLGFIRVLLFC